MLCCLPFSGAEHIRGGRRPRPQEELEVTTATKRLVIGTAGHIDHGKSSLVKALTGIDPDRLQEEKERGITIELGFAPLNLPNGQRLAFIDVPGHERFIKTMIAGATGIDLVLLVIAADEGIMPQTREHLDILTLLGVSRGVVVLSRLDLVDAELLELAEEEVRSFLQGSALADAPVVACSALTRQGLDVLLNTLEKLTSTLPERSAVGAFRLPIDRVFTLRGFGTVVTGTCGAGSVKPGDTLEVLPLGQKIKVRGLQVHGQEVPEAFAGQRVALNLQGVEKELLSRGMQLCAVGQGLVTSLLDASYQQLPTLEKGLRHQQRVRFLSGTGEVTGVVHLLGGALDETEEALNPGQGLLPPGKEGYLQLHLDEPVAARAGDRFILRLESPLQTLGGGVVLDPAPVRHRRQGRKQAAAWLQQLAHGSADEALSAWLGQAGLEGMPLERLARRAGYTEVALRTSLEPRLSRGELVLLEGGKRVVETQVLIACSHLQAERLHRLHTEAPQRAGFPKAELRDPAHFFGEAVWQQGLERLVQEGRVRVEGALYSLQEHVPQLRPAEAVVAARARELLLGAGLAPPLLQELRESLKVEPSTLVEVLNFLVLQGELVKVTEGHYMAAPALEDLKEQLVAFLRTHGELSPADFKELTGLSRKWAIPLLELLDKTQFTMRVGEVRKLRASL